MSYGYGDGPNWPLIQAKRRAEEQVSSARREGAAHQASAQRWKAAFETLAAQVKAAAVGRTGATHRDGGRCGCVSCWEKLINGLVKDAEGGRTSAGSPGAAGFTDPFDGLFGGSGPQQRP